MTEYFPDFISFFFLFSIDPQVLHDLEREYNNEFLALIDPEQPVSKRANYLDRKWNFGTKVLMKTPSQLVSTGEINTGL